MSLFGLRPEEPAAIRIREAATRGTLSHALLLTGSGDRMSAACFAATTGYGYDDVGREPPLRRLPRLPEGAGGHPSGRDHRPGPRP